MMEKIEFDIQNKIKKFFSRNLRGRSGYLDEN